MVQKFIHSHDYENLENYANHTFGILIRDVYRINRNFTKSLLKFYIIYSCTRVSSNQHTNSQI